MKTFDAIIEMNEICAKFIILAHKRLLQHAMSF